MDRFDGAARGDGLLVCRGETQNLPAQWLVCITVANLNTSLKVYLAKVVRLSLASSTWVDRSWR